jgi:hypothetical protein
MREWAPTHSPMRDNSLMRALHVINSRFLHAEDLVTCGINAVHLPLECAAAGDAGPRVRERDYASVGARAFPEDPAGSAWAATICPLRRRRLR